MIRLDNVSKLYSLRGNKPFLMRDLLGRMVGRKPSTTDFWALRNVSDRKSTRLNSSYRT